MILFSAFALGKYLWTFIISMLPLIEIRGAMPYAVGNNLAYFPALFAALLGNILPVPVIFFLARKVLEWGCELSNEKAARFFRFFHDKGEKARDKLLNSSEHGIYIALMLFVGIPIPGTGAWTGTLAASFLDLSFFKTCLAVIAGICIAALIMTLASFGIFSIV